MAFARLMREWLRRDREYWERQLLFDTAVGFVWDCNIEGDYLEFGCANGGSLIDVFDAAGRSPHAKHMRFFIFDSFQGLPQPSGLDAGEYERYRPGEYSCSLEDFKHNIQRGGVDLSRVTCIQGWYDQTLTAELKASLPLRKAAIILVDCDLYESTVPVLRFITDFVQTGTIIIFDDWLSYKGRLDRGEAKAFYEWLQQNPSIKANEFRRAGRGMMSFVLQLDETSLSSDL